MIDPKTKKQIHLTSYSSIRQSEVYFDETYIKYFIKEELEEMMKVYRDHIKLRFYLVYHLFAEMNYIQLAIVNILGFAQDSLSIKSKFNIYRLKLLIVKHLSNLNKNVAKDPSVSSLDIETLVKIEKDFYRLQSTVSDYSQKYFDFMDII